MFGIYVNKTYRIIFIAHQCVKETQYDINTSKNYNRRPSPKWNPFEQSLDKTKDKSIVRVDRIIRKLSKSELEGNDLKIKQIT